MFSDDLPFRSSIQWSYQFIMVIMITSLSFFFFFDWAVRIPLTLEVRGGRTWGPGGCWWLGAPQESAWLWPHGWPRMSSDGLKVSRPLPSTRTWDPVENWTEHSSWQPMSSLFVWGSGCHNEGPWKTGALGESSRWLLEQNSGNQRAGRLLWSLHQRVRGQPAQQTGGCSWFVSPSRSQMDVRFLNKYMV